MSEKCQMDSSWFYMQEILFIYSEHDYNVNKMDTIKYIYNKIQLNKPKIE